jgi:sterol desaturase/sphingolipid hydroxylase (fatty acid hydroxylase superfamily)
MMESSTAIKEPSPATTWMTMSATGSCDCFAEMRTQAMIRAKTAREVDQPAPMARPVAVRPVVAVVVTMAAVTMAAVTMAAVTMAAVTMAAVTMAVVTMAVVTMAVVTMAGAVMAVTGVMAVRGVMIRVELLSHSRPHAP